MISRGSQEPAVRSAGPQFPSFREHEGPYNVRHEELVGYDGKFWNTSDDLPPLSEEEFFAVVSHTKSVLNRYGVTNPDPPLDELDFFVVDDGYFDRTVRVEVANHIRFWEIVGALLEELSVSLRSWRLWRIMFSASNSDNVIVVYPDGVRVDEVERVPSVGDRVNQIAEEGLRAWSQRERHRTQRRRDLARALPGAFEELKNALTPAVLVRAFDTLSRTFLDTMDEGLPGRSIAILFREDPFLAPDGVGFLTAPPDEPFLSYCAMPDGRLLNLASYEAPVNSKVMLVFEPTSSTITLCRSGKKWTFGGR